MPLRPLTSSRPIRAAIVAILGLAILATGCTSPDETTTGGVSEEVAGLNTLGTAYLGQQKWSQAIASFEQALALRPGDPLLSTNLAIALNQQGEVDTAIQRLNDALAGEPDHPGAHYNMGLIDSRNGNFVEAAAHFEAVARFDPDDLLTQYYLASALARIDRGDEAIAAYRRALQADPTHVSSLYGLGRLLLQRGQQDEGADLITRSQAIRARSGLDEAVGSQYGEQGPYAMGAEFTVDTLAAPEAIEVKLQPIARVRVQIGSNGPAWTAATMNVGDPAPTVLLAQQASILQLAPPGRQEPVAPPAPDTREIVALEAGDLDHDGRVDLVAWLGEPAGAETTRGGSELEVALLVQRDDGTLEWRALGDPAMSVQPEGGWSFLTTLLVDRDHDGDLDIVWCWSGERSNDCRVATSDGSFGFDVRPGAEHRLGFGGIGGAGPVELALSDLDNDRDVDLLLRHGDGITFNSNQRDDTFLAALGGGKGPTVGAEGLNDSIPFDIDRDGWMDLILGTERGIFVAGNRRGRLLDPVALDADAAPTAVDALIAADLDNDGFVDLIAGGGGRTAWWRNRGVDGWEPRELQALGTADRPQLAFDGDGDGDLDLLAIGEDGSVALIANEGGDANGWIALALSGVGDNSRGIGTKVDVLAGALRQRFEIVRPLPLHVGLGSRELVHSARLLWPQGVLQDEIELSARQAHPIEQLDRKGTSCPLLYVQRDGDWRFVTDFLGGSAVGYQLAPSRFSTPDTDEYVLLDPAPTVDDAGQIRLRVNNQLQEVIWFDQLQLLAVDHPEGSQLLPDERLMPGPPYPEFSVYVGDDVRALRGARAVESDRDVGERLADRDRRYVDDFAKLPFKGYAELHTLELDLGALEAGQRTVLLLDGWIDYADSSANVAAAHAGARLVPPRLEVADGRGGWRAIDGSIGFPAGLPKTMTVDLTGLVDPSVPLVRIVTSMRIYWDRAQVMRGGESLPWHVQRVDPASAELRYGGFPRELRPTPGGPPIYDPSVVDAHSPWRAHRGRYTPFGPVVPLLESIDDRFVTTQRGDEIELSFAAPPAPAAGMRRSWLLFADGFGKDMDPNSAANDAVGPIPFHGMPTYPYDDSVVPPVEQDHLGRDPRVVSTTDPAGLAGARPQALLWGGRDR